MTIIVPSKSFYLFKRSCLCNNKVKGIRMKRRDAKNDTGFSKSLSDQPELEKDKSKDFYRTTRQA